MKNKLLFLLFMSLIFSCNPDDSMMDDPIVNPPISTTLELFQTQNSDGIIEFSWSDLSGYDSLSEYGAILFSTENIIIDTFIPPLGVNFSLPFEGTYISVPTSKSFTVYEDKVVPCGETLYAKLVIVVNGEVIESNVVEINSPQLEILNTDEIGKEFMMPNPNQFSGYFFNYATQELAHFDFGNQSLISKVELPFIVDFKTEILFGDNGFGEEIYISLNDDRIVIYDANTLNYKGEIMIDGEVKNMTTNDNGLIIAVLNINFQEELIVISRGSNSVVNTFGESWFGSNYEVFFSSKTEGKLFVQGDISGLGNFYLLDLNEDGVIENEQEIFNLFNDTFLKNVSISPDENYYIGRGKVYDVNTYDVVSEYDGTAIFSIRSNEAYSEDVTKALAYTNQSNTLTYVNFPEIDNILKVRYLLNSVTILRNGSDFYILGKNFPLQDGGMYLAKLVL